MDSSLPTNPSPSYLDISISAVQNFIESADDKVITALTPRSTFHVRSPLALSAGTMVIVVIIVVMIIGIIYARLRLRELRHQDTEKYNKYFIRPTPERRTNERWEKVEQLFQSQNPSDWRLGILEADAMLDELLAFMGYEGLNLGERLKSAHPANFPNLQLAWEAHKVRNAIAHQGLDYHLSAEEAWHTFKLFERVFRGTNFI